MKSLLSKHRLIRKLDKISPDYKTLCDIWEFIFLMHTMYMHSYYKETNLHLFLATVSPKFKDKYKCFVYREENFSITIMLGKLSNDIHIEINRNAQANSSDTEKISFNDGEYVFKDIYDEEKFRTIISCIMTGVAELINYYYKHKRF